MTIKESWGSMGPWRIAEGYTLVAGRLMGCLHQHHIFVGFLIPAGGFGLGLEGCVAAAVIWVLFQPSTSVSVHVLGKNFRPVTFSSLVLSWGDFGPQETFGNA